MPPDMFVEIDNIKGESVDASHKDEIDVLMWNWAASQSGSAHSGVGSGAGKAEIGDLSFTKYIDKATPLLVKACCAGTHFKTAQLTVRKAGGKAPVEYLKIKLRDGLISSVKMGGGYGESRLTEVVTLNFASFSYEYTPQTATGVAAATIPASWNVVTNSET